MHSSKKKKYLPVQYADNRKSHDSRQSLTELDLSQIQVNALFPISLELTSNQTTVLFTSHSQSDGINSSSPKENELDMQVVLQGGMGWQLSLPPNGQLPPLLLAIN